MLVYPHGISSWYILMAYPHGIHEQSNVLKLPHDSAWLLGSEVMWSLCGEGGLITVILH